MESGNSLFLSLIHISEPTRRTPISYAVFCFDYADNPEAWRNSMGLLANEVLPKSKHV